MLYNDFESFSSVNSPSHPQNFNWRQATPYVPIANTRPEQVRNDLPAPERCQIIVHKSVKCDACHNDVQEIRFDCVHYPSLTYYEKREQRHTLDHSNRNRDKQK